MNIITVIVTYFLVGSQDLPSHAQTRPFVFKQH